MGASKMDNKEKLATDGTLDIERRHTNTTQKTKKMSNTDPTKKTGEGEVNLFSCEG